MADEQETAKTEKYFDDQFDDEAVLLVFRKHPVVMRKGLIVGCLALLVGPVYTLAITYLRPMSAPGMGFFGLSFLASLVLAAIVFMPWWISWYFSVYIMTDQRLIQISQKGFFHKNVVDMGLDKIQMVNYEVSGLQETLLGFGTMRMQTMVGELVVHEVHHPAKIQKQILELLRDLGMHASANQREETPANAMSEEFDAE
jgi:hypothetical protein